MKALVPGAAEADMKAGTCFYPSFGPYVYMFIYTHIHMYTPVYMNTNTYIYTYIYTHV